MGCEFYPIVGRIAVSAVQPVRLVMVVSGGGVRLMRVGGCAQGGAAGFLDWVCKAGQQRAMAGCLAW